MKKVLVATLFAFTLLGSIAAAPNNKSEENPSIMCTDNTIIVRYGPGPDDFFELEIASHGGCVSTVASKGSPTAPGDYSHAAFVAQCKVLKEVLPQELWEEEVSFEMVPGIPIPVNTGGFGGKINTCTFVLQGYHSGEFTHDKSSTHLHVTI